MRAIGTAPVNVDQGRDDLKIVFHAMVDFADQPALAFKRARHFALGLVDAREGSLECIAQFLDLGGWSELSRQGRSPLRPARNSRRSAAAGEADE